jgi:hypothetical protein
MLELFLAHSRFLLSDFTITQMRAQIFNRSLLIENGSGNSFFLNIFALQHGRPAYLFTNNGIENRILSGESQTLKSYFWHGDTIGRKKCLKKS